MEQNYFGTNQIEKITLEKVFYRFFWRSWNNQSRKFAWSSNDNFGKKISLKILSYKSVRYKVTSSWIFESSQQRGSGRLNQHQFSKNDFSYLSFSKWSKRLKFGKKKRTFYENKRTNEGISKQCSEFHFWWHEFSSKKRNVKHKVVDWKVSSIWWLGQKKNPFWNFEIRWAQSVLK